VTGARDSCAVVGSSGQWALDSQGNGVKRVLRTLIVDDEEDMRVLMRATIQMANRGLGVACEASDGNEAIVVWRSCQPDVVVIDHRMPQLSGIEASRQILAERPDQPIVLFSAYLNDRLRRTAAEIGIRTCLSKDEVHRLPDTLWSIAAA
jgi:DNA-binding NarL/FixJ family response regulator